MDRWMIGLCFKGCEVLARAVLELCCAGQQSARLCGAVMGSFRAVSGLWKAVSGLWWAVVGSAGLGRAVGALTDCDGLCEAVQGGAMLCRAVLRGSAAEL